MMTLARIPQDVLDSMRAVVDYDMPTERTDFEREGEPEGHVYEHLVKVSAFVDGLRDHVIGAPSVHVVETGASFDNLFVFETERAADRFRAFRQMEGSDIDHGSTPVLDDAYVLAAVREDDFAIYLRERGVDLRSVPDDQILAMLDDMPEGFGPNADDTEWTRVHGPWLDGWAATFKGEETE